MNAAEALQVVLEAPVELEEGPEVEFQVVLQDSLAVPGCGGDSKVALQVSVLVVLQDAVEVPVGFSAKVTTAGALELVVEVVFEVAFGAMFEVVFEVVCEVMCEVVCEVVLELLLELVLEVVPEVVLEVVHEVVFEDVLHRPFPSVFETVTAFGLVAT